jgi:hypothetical protein
MSALADFKLAENMFDVRLDRFRCDIQQARDFLVGLVLCNQGKDVALAWACRESAGKRAPHLPGLFTGLLPR